MAVELPFEMEFILCLTYRCNLCCSMCTQYGAGFKNCAPAEMSIEEWICILDSIADVEPKPKLLFMGGEPLLYPDFDVLLRSARGYGFSVQIVTNGLLLDKYIRAFSDFKEKLTITLSIDGLGETHNRIRNMHGLFDKVINNMKCIQKFCPYAKININSVILPDNVDELPEFLEFMMENRINVVTLQHLQFSSEALNELTKKEWTERLGKSYGGGLIPRKEYLIDENYVEKIKTSFEKMKYSGAKNAFMFPALEEEELKNYYLDKDLDKIRPGRICTTPWMNPTIHPDGNVSNCIGNIIGNIKEQCFWDLWNNETANSLRASLMEHGKFKICSKCCNFYKSNFICAKDGVLRIKDKLLRLPNEINYVKSSKNGAFVLDKNVKTNDGTIPVVPVEIFSREMFDIINQNETIIAEFKDI